MTRLDLPAAGGLGLAAFLAGVPAFAEDDPVRTLPEVTVIQRTPLPGFAVPQSLYPGNAQQATDADIERAQAGNLPEFLERRLQGVSASDVQGSPMQREISYRGQRLSPLLGTPQGLSLYLDGVRMNQPFGDIVNWELLPEAAIAGLSLVPGSNPLYGLNTLAGALVLTTKSGLTHPGTEAEFSVGSHGRQRFDFGHGRQWEDGWHAYAAGTVAREDGWREQSSGRFGNIFFKAGRQQADTDWSLSLLHGESRLAGNGLVTEDLLAANRAAIYTAPDITRATDTLLSFQGSHALSPASRIGVQAWLRGGGRDASNGDIAEDWGEWLDSCEDDPAAARCSDPADPGFVGPAGISHRSRSRQHEAGAALQWTGTAGAHQFAIGTELAQSRTEHDQFTTPGLFDAHRTLVKAPVAETHEVALRGRSSRVALFAADVVTLSPRTQLTLAARWDRTRVRNELGQPDPLQAETFTYSKLNPSAGITQALTGATTLFASASQGTRVPTALELGCADPARPCTLPTGLQSDPFLQQVVSRTVEGGVRWRAGLGITGSAALFRTDNRDDIVFLRSGVSQAGYFANVPKTRRQGIELALQGRTLALQWSVGYTYLEATYQSEGVLPGPLSTARRPNTFRPGTPIAGLPRDQARAAVDWRVLPRLTVGADWRAVGSRVVAGNESGNRPELGRIAGYAVVDGRARWQIDDRWQLQLRVDNVFDRRYANGGAGNLDFFPAGAPLLPPGEPQAARFIAPGAPRMVAVALRYEWDR